jgi:hypothetical protein
MIEMIMYMGIGFLFAGIIGVAVMPLVHDRAVRLTIRRLEGTIPQSMAEIEADKDLLRAEFAMQTRRLEMILGQHKNKIAACLAEIGKKGDAINRLKIERDALKVEIVALNAEIEAHMKRPTLPAKPETTEREVVTLMRYWIPHRIHH